MKRQATTHAGHLQELFRRLVAVAFVVAAMLASNSVARAADAEQSIQQARQALQGRMHYPWYDAEADQLQPITVRVTSSTKWNLPDLSMLGRPLQTLLWVLAGLLLVALVYAIARSFIRRDAKRQASAADSGQPLDADRVDALPFLAERPRGDLLGEARRQYQACNYSEAIIYLFSYELVRLDRAALVQLGQGKTNRQYLRELTRLRPLKDMLEATMVRFEDVFFGSRPLERDSFEACWNQLDEFEHLVTQAQP